MSLRLASLLAALRLVTIVMAQKDQCASGTCDGIYKCVGWRQTGGCDPDGNRERRGDKGCTEFVPKDASGYCECSDGGRIRKVGCGHASFRCGDECALRDRYTCAGWRQTGACSSKGPREPSQDKACGVRIEAGSSGYCECGGGRTVRKSCDTETEAFTCQEECETELDHYQVLGLEAQATLQDVKKAFRKLSVKYHPDKQKTAREKESAQVHFTELRSAYEVLGDTAKKAAYDMGGSEMTDGKNMQKSGDMQGEVPVAMAHFYTGATFETSFQRLTVCRGCKNKHTTRCRACNQRCLNEIKMVEVQMGPMRFNQQQEVRSDEKCKHTQTPVEITVEKGMKDGHSMDFPSLGENRPGMIPGDLKMRLKSQPHNIFEWRGDNLHMDITVSLKQALLGFKQTITHLDNTLVTVQSNGIVSHGQVLRLHGLGMPRSTDYPDEQGDLLVKVAIAMPLSLTEKHKKWLHTNLPEGTDWTDYM